MKRSERGVSNRTIWSVVITISLVVIVFVSGCSIKKIQKDSSESQPSSQTSDMSENPTAEPGVSDITVSSETQHADLPSTDITDNEEPTESEDIGIRWYPDNSWVFVNNSWLNIRSGPSTDNPILTEVYYSQALKRTAVADYWSEIILPDGRTGYAYNSYLSLVPVEDLDTEQ